jgi:hypothetical protein
MNNMDLPRVLVVGTNPWREDGTAHTLKNIFSCWEPDRLALIYTKSGLPYTNVASRFFQISENLILKNLIKPWKPIGQEVKSTEIVDTKLTVEENARYAKAHKNPSMLLTICREFVWLFGHWRSKALNNFIKDFNPELLFIPIYPTVYTSWIQKYVIRKTKKPFACYLADDNYSYDSCNGFFSYLHRFWLRKNVRWLSTHCNQMYVIVEKEKEDTDNLFGTDSLILTKSIDFTNRPYAPHPLNKPIKFVYTGSLIIGRDKTMAMIADAINEVNKDGIKAELDIYSKDEPVAEVMARLNNGASHHRGFIQRDQVDRVQQEADVVVFAEALEGKAANIARLSFSTKITDYLANGKCILAVGKKDIAPIDYFEKNDSAIIAYSKQEIFQKISSIVNTPGLITEYSKKAYDCAVRNHEKKMVDARFIESMVKVVE